MYHFCTYFDRNYLIRGLALYRSLKRQVSKFTLSVLCFDDFTYKALSEMNLPELRPVSLEMFERGDDALLAAKADRNRVEYYFTCSPSWIRSVLANLPQGDVLTYLDADLYFYSSPARLFTELGNESILIIGHRFPDHLSYLEEYGVYNVGFLSFRNDVNGQACLRWWRERCLEWCYDRVEGDKFADQKYLDDWPSRFPHVVVAQHKGANLAPWNWARYAVDTSSGVAKVDGEPLIFYHFHGLKLLNRWLYVTAADARSYGLVRSPSRDWIYSGYVHALKETAKWAHRIVPQIAFEFGDIRSSDSGWRAAMNRIVRGELALDLMPNK